MDKMNSDNQTTDHDTGKDVDTRPWVKPDFQKEPLKEALSGSSSGSFIDGPEACYSTS